MYSSKNSDIKNFRTFCKGVIHQLKNHDFQGSLEAKLNELNKNQYEIRDLREKLYQKTSIS